MKKTAKSAVSSLLAWIDNADKIILPGSIVFLVLAISLAGTKAGKCVCVSGALAGIVICLRYLHICLFHPIVRDRMLVKGHFIMKVISFVILIPFICSAGIDIYNKCCASDDGVIATTDLLTDEEKNDHNTIFWDVYYHFVNPGSQHMTTAKGRPVAGLIAIFGIILLNGLLISTLTSWFERRKEQWINGDIRYNKRSFKAFRNAGNQFAGNRIAVVLGASENAPTIIKNLLDGKGETEKGRPYYVVLLTNGDVRSVREKIASYLNDDESGRLVIYNGQLDSVEEINHIPFEIASEIYILGESGGENLSNSYHDTQNMKCVHNIAAYLAQNQVEERIICRVSFEYQTTYSVFQFSDLPDNIKKHLTFIPFNCYEDWARTVFVDGEYSEKGKTDSEPRTITYTPLDGTGITADSDKSVHLIVVGMTKMGIALAIQAAQAAHYPNFRIDGSDHHRTRITFIDPDGESEMNFFIGRFQNLFNLSRHRYLDLSRQDYSLDAKWIDPLLDKSSEYKYLGPNFLDIEWEFIKGSVGQPGVQEYLRMSAEEAYCTGDGQTDKTYSCEGKSLLTIAICDMLSNEAIAAGIYMPENVYDKALQILVYQRESSEILHNLYCTELDNDQKVVYKRYSKLRPFGMLDADFTVDKKAYYGAMLCNFAYDRIFNVPLTEMYGRSDEIISDIKRQISELGLKEGTGTLQKAKTKWDSLKICDRWSNMYLFNSFMSKLRSLGSQENAGSLSHDKVVEGIERDRLNMVRCEHNRWNVQQLLMGFRAYTKQESEEYGRISDPDKAGAFKKAKKEGTEKAHLNLCSYEHLKETDPKAPIYDDILVMAIPDIISAAESQIRS